MKKYILLCSAVLFTLQATAQNGFFLQPIASTGFSKTVVHNFGGQPDYKNVTSTNFSFGIGYKLNKWRFATGISYLRTGNSIDLTFATFDPLTGTLTGIQHRTQCYYFHHLVVPVTAGYQLNLSRKLSLVPTLGAELSYNIDEKETLTGYPDRTMSNESFNNNYHRVSLWATANVHLEYAVGKTLSIFAGPSAHVMLSNMYKVPAGAPYNATQHNNAYLFDAGVLWFFHKKVKTETKVQ